MRLHNSGTWRHSAYVSYRKWRTRNHGSRAPRPTHIPMTVIWIIRIQCIIPNHGYQSMIMTLSRQSLQSVRLKLLFFFVVWIVHSNYCYRWPRGLRRTSAAASLLGLRVRIPPWTWIVVCCQLEFCATGRSLFKRSPSECGVSWMWSGATVTLFTCSEWVDRVYCYSCCRQDCSEMVASFNALASHTALLLTLLRIL